MKNPLKDEIDARLFYADPEELTAEEQARVVAQMKEIAARHRAVRQSVSVRRQKKEAEK